MAPDVRLLIFAKAPVPGRVKTRLRSAWGARGACFWYKRLLDATVQVAVESGVAPVELWCTPGRSHPRLRSLARRYDLPMHVQSPGDLGDRMLDSGRQVLRRADAVMIIGADCASLTAIELNRAVNGLEVGHDLVLKPATDGGYMLIGFRRAVPGLFRGVAWGSASVLRQTRGRMRRARLRTLELPPGEDADLPADVRQLLRRGFLRPWSGP